MKKLGIQVKRNMEQEDLEYVQKHIDLGWELVSKQNLGEEVYFVYLVWNRDGDPVTPNQQDK